MCYEAVAPILENPYFFGLGGIKQIKEMYYLLLSLKMVSFVLFPQASLPSMNFNISELVYFSDFYPAHTNKRKKKSPSYLFRNAYSECCWPRLFCLVNGKFGDHVTVRQTARPSAAQAHQCKITQSTGMASQMQL